MEHFILLLLKTPRGRCAVGLALFLFGFLLFELSWPQLGDLQALVRNGRLIVAEVIDFRTTTSYGFVKDYDLRYQFRLMRGGPSFSKSEKGWLARKELWSTVPKAAWEEASRTGKVALEYLPSDPTVNELAGNARSQLRSTYFLIAIAASIASCGAALVVNGIIKLRRKHSRGV